MAWLYGVCIFLFIVVAAFYSHGPIYGFGDLIKGFLNPLFIVYFIPSIILVILADKASAHANVKALPNRTVLEKHSRIAHPNNKPDLLDFPGLYMVKEVHEESAWFGGNEFEGKQFKVINATRSLHANEDNAWISCFLDEVGTGNGSFYLSGCKLEKAQ